LSCAVKESFLIKNYLRSLVNPARYFYQAGFVCFTTYVFLGLQAFGKACLALPAGTLVFNHAKTRKDIRKDILDKIF
jgi:hypothetical protein